MPITRRTLPSGALAVEVSDPGGTVVWNAEVVPRAGSKPTRIRVSTPVTFDLSDLTAGQIQEELGELRQNMWALDALER